MQKKKSASGQGGIFPTTNLANHKKVSCLTYYTFTNSQYSKKEASQEKDTLRPKEQWSLKVTWRVHAELELAYLKTPNKVKTPQNTQKLIGREGRVVPSVSSVLIEMHYT